MAVDQQNVPQHAAVPPNVSVYHYGRLLLAWGITVGVLPYAWARTLVFWMLVGEPEPLFVTLLGVGLAAGIVLVYGVAPAFAGWRARPWIALALVVPWVIINGVLIMLFNGGLVPWPYVVLLFVPGTFWPAWAVWMFFWPWRWPARLGILALLVAGVAVPLTFLETEGLSGGSRINFAFKKRDEATRGADADSAGTIIDLTQTSADDYPQFMGPQRLGVLPQARLARDWTKTPPRELWRRRLGGKRGDAGWSGFAVVGNYAITQEQRDDEECVVCYRVADGARMWLHAEPVRFSTSLGGPGPRATPTIVDGHVYAIGATGILNCLEGATGRRSWSVNILEDNQADNMSHGVCASPLVDGERVIVCPTGARGPSLVAYERATGKQLWQAGEHQASYGSPLLANLGGVQQILLFNADGVAGHAAADGKVLWHFPWTNSTQVNSSQPIPNAGDADQVFVATGYGKGCALLRVAQAAGGAWSVKQRWRSKDLRTKFSSAVLYQGFVYGLDEDTLVCLDLETGKQRWRQGDYQFGQILLAGDLLLIQAENGDVVLVQPNSERLHELGRIPALSGKTWNNPTLAGRFLLVRNDKEAACYELPLAER
jgi:outer membrane protein assembly factor BamB